MNEQETKTKYMELQMLSQQLQQGDQQLQQLDIQIAELKKVIEDLNDLKNTKEGTEIFTPVTAGIFTKAKIGNTNELLVNVGANVAVKKSLDESKELVNNQISEIGKIRIEMAQNIDKLNIHAAHLQEEIIKSKVDQ